MVVQPSLKRLHDAPDFSGAQHHKILKIVKNSFGLAQKLLNIVIIWTGTTPLKFAISMGKELFCIFRIQVAEREERKSLEANSIV